MKVAVVTDLHFVMEQSGDSYTPVMYGNQFFQRYRNIFEDVYVVARGEKTIKAPINSLKINGNGIKTVMLPSTHGIKEYAIHYSEMYKKMYATMASCDTSIIRMPSALSTMAVSIANKLRKPYALEVVADPYSVKPGKSLANRLISYFIVGSCKKACMTANGVAYVTKDFLQSICPCKAVVAGKDTDEYFTGNYSSVTLAEEFYGSPKRFEGQKKYVITHTANLIQNEAKGHGVVIRTIAELRKKGYDVSVVFIGDGCAVPEFKALAETLGVADSVRFAGKIANPMLIKEELIKSDFYLFPSEAEGLPRSVIEAMACGLVVVASNVSGIPELLEKKELYAPKDVEAYVKRLAELMDSPGEMAKLSARNIEVARRYSNANLTINRNIFYGKLRKLVETKQA